MIDFIKAEAYNGIYLFLVTIMTLIVRKKYSNIEGVPFFRYSNNEGINILIVVFFIVFFGLRPESWRFVDMLNYISNYHAFYEGVPFEFDWNTENILFDNLFAWWGSVSLGTTSFFFIIAIIYFGCSYLGIRRLFPDHKLAAYLIFLGAFSTFSYATNGVKAGAAASIFIWAISYRENLKLCIPLILVSWGFHHSMQLPFAAFVLTMFYKNPKWYYYGWAFCLMIALAHITLFANLFAEYSDESGAGYLAGAANGTDDGTRGGFRLDFVLYSSVPVIVGYIVEMKRKMVTSEPYRELIHLYVCINGVWMLCMYSNFTNRIAYLSWFLYPIVLIYPFLNEGWGLKKYKVFSKVMLYHLFFTLFMMIFYDGLIQLILG